MDIKSIWRGSEGVHEEITQRAAREAGYSDWSIQQLIRGAIDNDFPMTSGSRFLNYLNIPGLLWRHYANESQPSHFLRKEEHEGRTADQEAIRAGTQFIKDNFLNAVNLLRESDRLSHAGNLKEATEKKEEALFALGKAIHTLQDSYSHAIRDYSDQQNWGKITHVMSFKGDNADHDPRLDTGRTSSGDLSIQAEEAGVATRKMLELANSLRDSSFDSNLQQSVDSLQINLFLNEQFQYESPDTNINLWDIGAAQLPTPIDAEQEAIESGIEATQELAGRGVWGDFTPDTGGEQTPVPSEFNANAEAGYFTPDTGGEQTSAPSEFGQDTGYFTPDIGFEQTPAPSGFGDDIGYFTPESGGEQPIQPPAWSGQDVGDFTPDTGFEQTPAPSGFSDDMGYFTPDTGFEQSIQPPAWSGQDVGDFTPNTGGEQSFQPPVWSGQDVGDFTPETGGEQSIPPPDWST